MITASNLQVAYGKNPVVKNVSLAANAGELTAMIGPNGSGKTSLMRALCGENPYLGSTTLNGMEISATPANKLAIYRGVLPQFSNVAFPFTVGEIVRLGLTAGIAAIGRSDAAELVLRALEKVGLVDYVGKKYQELSGGEQQRVQFARVLCQVWEPVVDNIPRWLFLDEPISSLDIQHQLAIMDISKDFAIKGGGVISILHDLNLAAMYADQIILMKDGEIERAGEPSHVLQDDTLASAFGCHLKVGKVPPKGQKFILPQSVML